MPTQQPIPLSATTARHTTHCATEAGMTVAEQRHLQRERVAALAIT